MTISNRASIKPDKLFEYGIQTEDSSHRIHVDIYGRVLFIYKTIDGVAALPEPIRPVSESDWSINGYYLVSMDKRNNGFATARGIRVRYENINGCRMATIPDDLIGSDIFSAKSTSAKGNSGVSIAYKMLERGLVPFPFIVREVNNKTDQIKGVDLSVNEMTIQIKFDGRAFERGLFLQTHEWNPRGEH